MKIINRFAYRLLATCLMMSLLIIGAQPALAKDKRQYYEMRVYRFTSETQKKMVEDYFRTAAIPALNRLGINTVGVFGEADQKDGMKLYVMMPFKSIEQFLQLPEKLAGDAAYQKAAATYLNSDPASPAYDRYESSLMQAFVNWPELKVPTTAAPKSERVYEYRLYESHSEVKGQKKIDMFNAGGEINIFVRLGFNPVYYAQTIVGAKQPNLTYMTTFDNKASRDAHWKAFGEDSEWNRIKVLPEYDHAMTKAEIHFLTPMDYSQI